MFISKIKSLNVSLIICFMILIIIYKNFLFKFKMVGVHYELFNLTMLLEEDRGCSSNLRRNKRRKTLRYV